MWKGMLFFAFCSLFWSTLHCAPQLEIARTCAGFVIPGKILARVSFSHSSAPCLRPHLPVNHAASRGHASSGVETSGSTRLVCLNPSFGSMALDEAQGLLSRYDAGHQEAARTGGKGLGGGTSATEWGDSFIEKEGLRQAVVAMASQSTRTMLGICASSAPEGVATLKAWVGSLGLVKGRLHGMDRDGQPVDMSEFGAVYIKYNSAGGDISEPGDAMLNGYAGDFRGVYFSPSLPDGEFRQYAVLPLSLFSALSRHGSGGVGAGSGGEDGSELLMKVAGVLDKLGARAEVAEFDQMFGLVVVRFEGDASLKFGVEDAILADPRVKRVEFIDF